MAVLPDGETDERSAETALAIALGGVICPVPFLMSGVAMRIARGRAGRGSRRARIAFWLAAVTIVAQAAGIVVLLVVLL